MQVIAVRNVHEALPIGIALLKNAPRTGSRVGDVAVSSMPVTTHYYAPQERVLFWPERDANPFFHFFEGLWMLAGREDLAFLIRFNKRMATFSDDGATLRGAYGYRWRRWFDRDQLSIMIDLLTKKPATRRAVLTMFDPKADLRTDEALLDIPCNTQAYFWIQDNKLNMTVCCRSNDIIYGAYGANAVHFSMLQEYVANMLDIPMGSYWQISNNFHAYLGTLNPLMNMKVNTYTWGCPYTTGLVSPYPKMVTNRAQFDMDLNHFFYAVELGAEFTWYNPFFTDVALPLYRAHKAWKETVGPHRFLDAYKALQGCQALDWKLAATEWLRRREMKSNA